MDDQSISEILAEAQQHVAQAQAVPPQSSEAAEHRNKAVELLERASALVRQLSIFSANEDYSEHSPKSLRLLQVPFLLGTAINSEYPAHDDPERDEKRIAILKRAKDCLVKFLVDLNMMQLTFASAEVLDQYVDHLPGQRRDRDAKVAHLTSLHASESTAKELEELVAACEDHADEELEAELVIALLNTQMLKACDSIEMMDAELDMLQQIKQRREQGLDVRPPPPPKASEPPLQLTKDMLQHIVRGGKTIDRSSFKLLTKGYGPIGAPTMSLEAFAEQEVVEAMAREEQQKQAEADELRSREEETDEQTDERERLELLRHDEWRDDHRHGEGNRYNMG